MKNATLIWWIIVILVAVAIVWSYYWTDEKKCCTIEGLDEGVADGVNSLTYCKRNGKFFVSGVGGIGGVIPEKEISEEEFLKGWANSKCKKS